MLIGQRIYFIRCAGNGAIKIGTSGDPELRLRDLQMGCPYELELLGTLPGMRADELALHRRFASLWLRGEWFSPGPDLLDFIRLRTRPGH